MALSIALLFLGYFSDSILLQFCGYTIVFLVNASTIVSGWQYENGQQTITTVTGNTTTANELPQYTNYSEGVVNTPRIISFLFSVVSFFGATWVLYDKYVPKEDS
jgi:hypothetical protein